MSPLGQNFGTPLEARKQNRPLLREAQNLLTEIETSYVVKAGDRYGYRVDISGEELKERIGDLKGKIEQALTPSSSFVSKVKWDCLFCGRALELEQTNIDYPNTDKTCSGCGTPYIVIWREKRVKVK